ncbi:radical SAM/SPASM domain-containing protein [Azospirillum griseum]|nr:radical SAM protein [Azospirillum griseum]
MTALSRPLMRQDAFRDGRADTGMPERPGIIDAAALVAASAPRSDALHLLSVDGGDHLLLVDGSRLFRIDADLRGRLERATANGALSDLLDELGLGGPPLINDQPVVDPPLHALSLAVSQACNLGCGYCYAGQGSFGKPPRKMPLDTALAAVERLVNGAPEGGRVTLAFMGGEPLVNRPVIQAATRYAQELASLRGVRVNHSITTNGTLVTPEDGDFFEEFGFAVTISLDGPADQHDRLRPFKDGRGSFDRIMANIAPLLKQQRRMQVSARVTVTPDNLDLPATLDRFIADGFHSVGFSPLLHGSAGRNEMDRGALLVMLDQMVACGAAFERAVLEGRRYPFANLVNALREIHRGTHRPYPCGAGAGYLGVSADGDLSACHRFVEDESGAMGSLSAGIDAVRQNGWLHDRHVHRQEPCRSCWARYMCGGGCHHEVIGSGRLSCEYVRGWLHYCLSAYLRLSDARPGWFAGAPTDPNPAMVP